MAWFSCTKGPSGAAIQFQVWSITMRRSSGSDQKRSQTSRQVASFTSFGSAASQ
jgi:hypothetical protein